MYTMQKTTLKVLFSTLAITLFIFGGSYYYYDSINSSEDPRILQARTLLQQYEKELEEDQPGLALGILDEIERIYRNTPGYEQSYEIGVILNNKATVYLVQLETKILEKQNLKKEEMIETLAKAEKHTLEALAIYEEWQAKIGPLNKEDLFSVTKANFSPNDPELKGYNIEELIVKRVDDLEVAQIETPRRISVSLTNLGFINRYKGDLLEAKKNYEKAIELWERNYTAKDNLNMLLNQPIKKRSIVDRLFPPDKNKEGEENNS